MKGYDQWKLASPYDKAPEECPECPDGFLEYDDIEKCVSCTECSYLDGQDWGVDDAAL